MTEAYNYAAIERAAAAASLLPDDLAVDSLDSLTGDQRQWLVDVVQAIKAMYDPDGRDDG